MARVRSEPRPQNMSPPMPCTSPRRTSFSSWTRWKRTHSAPPTAPPAMLVAASSYVRKCKYLLFIRKMVPPVRIELTAPPLPRVCSTPELRRHGGGGRCHRGRGLARVISGLFSGWSLGAGAAPRGAKWPFLRLDLAPIRPHLAKGLVAPSVPRAQGFSGRQMREAGDVLNQDPERTATARSRGVAGELEAPQGASPRAPSGARAGSSDGEGGGGGPTAAAAAQQVLRAGRLSIRNRQPHGSSDSGVHHRLHHEAVTPARPGRRPCNRDARCPGDRFSWSER
jgi:hypothetical protein